MPSLPTSRPVRKVSAGTGGGVLAALIIALTGQAGVDLPAEVAALIVAAIGGIIGWLVPSSHRDVEDAHDQLVLSQTRRPGTTVRTPPIVGIAAVGLLVVSLTAGCSWLTREIDMATGTTLEERCQDYRLDIALMSVLLAADGDLSEGNQRLLDTSTAFVEAYCAGVGSPEPLPPPEPPEPPAAEPVEPSAPADGIV